MGTPLSLVMLDIDHFKQYNDSHGHPAGDALLKWVGMTLRSAVRSHDVVARYGGEEFVVLLPATNASEGVEVAERLRFAVSVGPPSEFAVTASFGVATLGPATPTPSALVEHADQALYRSKRAGRDQITHYQGCPRKHPNRPQHSLRQRGPPYVEPVRDDTHCALDPTAAPEKNLDSGKRKWCQLE